MRNKLAAILLAVVCLLAVSVPVFAHHGYAAYDTDRKVTPTRRPVPGQL